MSQSQVRVLLNEVVTILSVSLGQQNTAKNLNSMQNQCIVPILGLNNSSTVEQSLGNFTNPVHQLIN